MTRHARSTASRSPLVPDSDPTNFKLNAEDTQQPQQEFESTAARPRVVWSSDPAPAAARAAGPITSAQYLRLLHPPTSRGWAFLCCTVRVEGLDEPRWHRDRVRASEIPQVGSTFADGWSDRYVTMSRYLGATNSEALLAELGCCWVDLDYYKTRRAVWSPEQVLMEVQMRLKDGRLPSPSVVLSSGRGLLCVWLHTPVPAAALPRWKRIQVSLHDALSGLGVDRSGTTPTKVFRVVGSLNRGVPVRAIYPNDASSVVRWDFEDLAREVLPLTRGQVLKRRRQRDKSRRRVVATRTSEEGDKRSGCAQFAVHRYWIEVRDEIHALRVHRYGDQFVAAGMRDLFLFTLAICEAWLTPADQLLSKLTDVGRAIAGWNRQRVRSAVCTVVSRSQKAAHPEKAKSTGRRRDPRYKIRGEAVAEKLEVTEAEAEALGLVHVAPAETKKARRRASQRRCRDRQGVVSQSARRQNRVDVSIRLRALMSDGLSLRAAAARVGIPLSTAHAAMVAFPSQR